MSLLAAEKFKEGYRQREREHFDNLAEREEEIWWGHKRPAAALRLQRRINMLSRFLNSMTDPKVLEIGCGAGIFSKTLLESSPDLRLVACDISPKSVKLAQQRCQQFQHFSVEIGDVLEDQYDGQSFDAVVGNSILHHFQLAEYLPRALASLKPGGLFWFSEPNMLNPQIAIERNVRFIGKWLDNSEDETAFFPGKLRKLLLEAGFERVAVTPFDFMHPALPHSMLPLADLIGKTMEQIPGIRSIAGSLEVVAFKPAR